MTNKAGRITISDKFIDVIKYRIYEHPLGYAFHVADFTDLADYDIVKQSLARLKRNGKIQRVLRGIYDKSVYSELSQEAPPAPLQIVSALARRYNWTISLSGDTALNLLGLSTQALQ